MYRILVQEQRPLRVRRTLVHYPSRCRRTPTDSVEYTGGWAGLFLIGTGSMGNGWIDNQVFRRVEKRSYYHLPAAVLNCLSSYTRIVHIHIHILSDNLFSRLDFPHLISFCRFSKTDRYSHRPKKKTKRRNILQYPKKSKSKKIIQKVHSAMFIYLSFAAIFLWAVRAAYIRRKLPKGAKWLPGPPGMSFLVVASIYLHLRERERCKLKLTSSSFLSLSQGCR